MQKWDIKSAHIQNKLNKSQISCKDATHIQTSIFNNNNKKKKRKKRYMLVYLGVAEVGILKYFKR